MISTVRDNMCGAARYLVAVLLAGLAIAPAQPQAAASDASRARRASSTSAVRPAATGDDEIAQATAAAGRHPGEATWCRLGDAFMQKGRETSDVSYYGRAEGAYRKALASSPNSVDAMIGMAWVEGGRHEFEHSIDWATKALAIDPKRADAFGLMGDAAVEMGDYEAAFEHYQQMLDLRPDISSYSRGAHLLFLTGDVRKAALLMTKAIASGGPYAENTAWCRAQWALMQFAQGSYLSASQMLNEGLRTAPGNYHLLVAMGKVKAAMKDFPAAIDYYKRAEAIVPQHDVVVALGDLYMLQGKTEEASAQYALVGVIHKLNRANGVIGDLQTAQFFADHDRDLPEALKLAEAEYKTRPNVYAADTLAWCYYKNGRIKEARKYIAKALSHNTPEAMFLYHKGVICAKTGEMAAARTALYQALSDSPNFHPLAAPAAARMLDELGARGQEGEKTASVAESPMVSQD